MSREEHLTEAERLVLLAQNPEITTGLGEGWRELALHAAEIHLKLAEAKDRAVRTRQI